MRRLRRFVALPAPEKRLLVTAVLLLPLVRVALLAVPFQTLRRLLATLARPPNVVNAVRRLTPERLAWAVTAAARHMPGTWTCLVQALALRVLLYRHGHPATLRLGVARQGSGEFAAHAWVECEGRPVGGASLASGFTPLPALEGK